MKSGQCTGSPANLVLVMTTIVWILAGVTAWCVAALALALLIGPVVRKHPARPRHWQSAPETVGVARQAGSMTWDAHAVGLAPVMDSVQALEREPQFQ